jgi:hypothetical protein
VGVKKIGIKIIIHPEGTSPQIQYNTIQYNTIQYNTIQYNTGVYIIHFDHFPPPPSGHHFFFPDAPGGAKPLPAAGGLQGGAVAHPAKNFEFLTPKDAFLSRF